MLTDAQLDVELRQLRQKRRACPANKEADLVQGLALLAVAAERELRLAAYPVQLVAAAALVRGCFAEVDTGEGKTLAIGLAAAYLSWDGQPCHVITANDYLAERDPRLLEDFYTRVGLTSSSVLSESSDDDRWTAYACSVTYTTAKEAAADYLRDRLRLRAFPRSLAVVSPEQGLASRAAVQRGLHYALVDEADHALIDESVTPLIISRASGTSEMVGAAVAVWSLVKTFKAGEHYELEPQRKVITVLKPGIAAAVHELGLPHTGLWSSRRRRIELVRMALEAKEFFRLDEQYVIKDRKIVIVDPSTGRPMPMRTWRQGLHQVIEAKENLPITPETETLTRISFQAFFRSYPHLAGASGTLAEAAGELWQIYSVAFVKIPRHLPSQRQHAGVRFAPDAQSQREVLLHEVKTRHARGQPLLIGTRTVDASEQLMQIFQEHSLKCQLLNARRLHEESQLVANAGQRHHLTIATSMAGRGTDIRLGNGVAALGGLHVITAEANESSRVDRQLFGRSARQGDPGSVMAIYHPEDLVLQRFIPTPLRQSLAWMLRRSWASPVGQVYGRCLLRWAHFRAGTLASRSRSRVIDGELEVKRSLGFSVGRSRL
jgi:preprotein translocase subunit SecA